MYLTPFLLEFQSWHWKREFHDEELADAFAATNDPTTPEEFERGFLTLLRSGDTVACGIALDYYDRAEMTERFVGGNPLEPHAEEVFAVARRLLAQPPRPADTIAEEGANHASALGALMRGGLDSEDTDAIAGILERMPDGGLRESALDAARILVDDTMDQEKADSDEGGATPDRRLVTLIARVEACRDRVETISALREDSGAEATESLVRAATDDAEWRVRQEAAAALTAGGRFYPQRPLLERLARSWSDDERSAAADEVRDALAEGLHSLHWQGTEPLGAELSEAHRQVRSPTGEAVHRQAFRTLLHSGSPVSVGIALDHFHNAQGLTRFGLDDAEHAPEVLAVAREVLRQPPSPAALSPRTGAGASHASALNVLQDLGEPEDAMAIAAVLRDNSVSVEVLECAVDAASCCLERWTAPNEPLITALEELIFDSSADMELRTDAVNTLFGLDAPRVTAVLVRAARAAELPIQVEGAIGLTFHHLIDQHRELLREVVDSWPQDAGDRAQIVLNEMGR
ncbi:hypothetical protein [Streptomyces coffeae]|uniref:HEAT repeat domain-containing protein n=1 Tax=Streptomyces coffeae TaxID=621382 RepID=A0ABS1NFA6_9ACTN|nr:hypothetical protein [Streptomyces coffeae]MBL1098632.1 hypothetical protein [Streptomyces coffeae]